MMLRKYCTVHDSLWLHSMGKDPVCEMKAAEVERDGVVPSSGECNFIEVELVRKGSIRLGNRKGI